MSILDGLKPFVVDRFDGSKPLLDILNVEPGDALRSMNCKYVPGRVLTRAGFVPDVVTGVPIYNTSLHFFQQALASSAAVPYLAMYRKQAIGSLGDIVIRNLDTGTDTTIYTPSTTWTGSTILFAAVSPRLYAANINTSGGGTGQGGGLVWDGNTAHTMDAAFQRPLRTTEVTLALTQPNAGVMTAGDHYVGILFETRNGYWTRPGPVDASLVLQPQKITSTGTNSITITLTPATVWPAWIKSFQVIVTTTLNNFQYYVVPGTITNVTAGGATPASLDINVADLQLRSIGSQGAGTLADDFFGLLCMDASNNPPFSPTNVIPWGNRLVWFGNYGGVDCFFPSDAENYEQISSDQHLLQLPGNLNIGAAFVLHGILYVISKTGGLFAYRDNGGRPVTFQPPQLIDGRINALYPYQVTVSSGSGYAVIGSPQGLFVYSGGMFPQVPLSYFQHPEWIQEENPNCVKDFIHDQIIIVSTVQHGWMVWNYQNGMTPERVRYSKWTFGDSDTVDGANDVEICQSTSKPQPFVVRVSHSQPAILRMKAIPNFDLMATLYNDVSWADGTTLIPIDWQYQTSLLPSGGTGEYLQHLACRFRAFSTQATGSIVINTISMDGAATVVPIASPISLTLTPGQEYLAVYDMQNEMVSYLFTNGKLVSNGVSLSRVTHFYNTAALHR